MSTLHPVAGCDNPKRQVDVVFIHGLGGDAFGTWRYSDADDAFWPLWLAKEIPEAGVWTLSYPAGPTSHMRWIRRIPWLGPKIAGPNPSDAGHAAALPDRAVQVLDQLRVKKAFGLGHRPLVLVCHSLGGLLAKHLLRASVDATDPASQALAHQTRGVLFLATPHSGATLASLLNAFSTVFRTTVAVEELREHDAHLRNLQVWYRDRAKDKGWHTVSYFEQRSVGDVLPIVNATSADPGVGRPVGLDDDHLSIAKPRNREAQVFEAAVELVRQALTPPSAPLPPGTPIPLAALAPIHPTRSAPHELPPQPAHGLFGRAAEKAQLVQRLQQGQTTWVVGPAGMGKTGLAAVALAETLGQPEPNTQSRQMYPDGVIYLDLYALKGQVQSAAAELASRLGAAPDPSSDELNRARQACTGRRLLLVLEGAEEAGNDPRHGLDDLLAVLDRHSRALVLTRDLTQADPAHLLRLDEQLSPPEAQAMLDTWLAQTAVTPELRGRVLRLANGHPLTLTWAGGLLALGDEPAALLVADWEVAPLPALNDPHHRDHSLAWLFERSVRRLDEDARQMLATMGSLAHAPVDLNLVCTAMGDAAQTRLHQRARDALRRCVQLQLLRHEDNEDSTVAWKFSHVLAYQFAREQLPISPSTCAALGNHLANRLKTALSQRSGQPLSVAMSAQQHALSVLSPRGSSAITTEEAKGLYRALVVPLLYDIPEQWEAAGHLSQCLSVVEAIQSWLKLAPLEADPGGVSWQRDVAVCYSWKGNMHLNQSNLANALIAFFESFAIHQRLTQADPANAQRLCDLSISQAKIGDVLQKQGDLTEALRVFSGALATHLRLAQIDPTRVQWRRNLSISHQRVGTVLFAKGQLAAALDSFSKGLRIAQSLANDAPTDDEKQHEPPRLSWRPVGLSQAATMAV